MGYDFLGTMAKDQWDKIKNFTKTHQALIQINEQTNEHSLYIKHVIAEALRAERMLTDLQKVCKTHFDGFEGDFQYMEDIEKPEQVFRLKLSDADTATQVYKMKDFQRPILKRKKDNLEYRIKKARDLVDQLEQKVLTCLTAHIVLPKYIKAVDQHFLDGYHKSNLSMSAGAMYTKYGQVRHDPSVNVRVDPPNLEPETPPPTPNTTSDFDRDRHQQAAQPDQEPHSSRREGQSGRAVPPSA